MSESEPPLTHRWERWQWEPLLEAINAKECTPFLGAGACFGHLPLGGRIAEDWATEFDYPFPDSSNLPKVAKYVAVTRHRELPGRKLIKRFSEERPDGYANPPNCHRTIANLDLPLYMTSNYDDFLYEALRMIPRKNAPGSNRQPQRVLCRWNKYLQEFQDDRFRPSSSPSMEQPWVFHLHGHIFERESMVLTEDDYLEFLVNVSEERGLLTTEIEKAVAKNTLLFLGYALEDLNFRVILRRLASYLRVSGASQHFAVQLAPKRKGEHDPEWERRVSEYFERNYHLDRVQVFWGTCDEFLDELKWAAAR